MSTAIFDKPELLAKFGPMAGYLTLISLVFFLLSLLIIPIIVTRLPSTYFLRLTHPQPLRQRTIKSLFLTILLNLLGSILLLGGVAMLFLPGQGLLTIIFSFLLLSIPGKNKIILIFIRKPSVQTSLNWIRSQKKCDPFAWPK